MTVKRPPKATKKAPKEKRVRVPVSCDAEQYERYTKAARMLGGMELAVLFRQALDEKIRRENLT